MKKSVAKLRHKGYDCLGKKRRGKYGVSDNQKRCQRIAKKRIDRKAMKYENECE